MPERRAQAYGEVLWFGGRVTALTLVSFMFMVRKELRWRNFPWRSESVQVFSSVIAAWSDASQILIPVEGGLGSLTSVVTSLNVGYVWMLVNCLVSATYVRRFNYKEDSIDIILWQVLAMRKKIKATGFSDWDSMFYNNLLSIPVLLLFSLIVEDWSSTNLEQSLYVNLCRATDVTCRLAHGFFITDAARTRHATYSSSLLHFRVLPQLGFHLLQRGVSA
jgi:GDP-mannose transporter